MLKGKSGIVYTILKLIFCVISCWEIFYLQNSFHKETQIILTAVMVANGYFRQFYLYKKPKLHQYGRISILLDFAIGAYIAWLRPVGFVIILITPAIFESIAVYSILFGGIVTASGLVTLITIDILSQVHIYDFLRFFNQMLVSYILGYTLIFFVSYLASLQFREREKVERANSELEQAYKQLLDNALKLQELSVEKERTRMAREIHDTLAHTLTAVIVQLEACKKLIDIDTARAKAEIDNAQQLTRAGLGDVKRTIKALRPEMLENSSLSGALRNLVQEIERKAHVKIEFNDDTLREAELSSNTEIALFRVIQETITNSIRHGAAKQIDIAMGKQGNSLNIDISDNGKGCTHFKEGYGLKGIVERIKSLGGTANFFGKPGNGFYTQITIPYEGSASGND